MFRREPAVFRREPAMNILGDLLGQVDGILKCAAAGNAPCAGKLLYEGIEPWISRSSSGSLVDETRLPQFARTVVFTFSYLAMRIADHENEDIGPFDFTQ